MVSYTPTVTADVTGLAWVNGAETPVEKRERLRQFLGPAVIEAVRALDKGKDPGTAVSTLVDAFLPDTLKMVLALFEGGLVLSSQDVVERLGLQLSVASNRLTQLERLGKISCVSRSGNSRRFMILTRDPEATYDGN
jgi:hypothetical protein